MPERGTNIRPQMATKHRRIVYNTTVPHLFWGSLVCSLNSISWSLLRGIHRTKTKLYGASANRRSATKFDSLCVYENVFPVFRFVRMIGWSRYDDDEQPMYPAGWWSDCAYLLVFGLMPCARNLFYLDIENGRFRCAGWWLA